MSRRDDRDEYEPEDGEGRPPVRKTSVLAITSLILGASSLCLCFATGLPALICGGISLIQIGSSKGQLGGMGLAIGGLLLGLVGTCGSTGVAGYFGYNAFQTSNDQRLALNNLKQIGLAMHIYHDANNRLPPAAAPAPAGAPNFPFPPVPNPNRPAVSWRVLLLPYLEQGHLFNQYRMDEPWDSANNRNVLNQMPEVYAAGRKKPGQTTTPYQVFVGPGTPFEPGAQVTITGIPDGTSNTIFVAESATEVPWTKPEDMPFTLNGPLPKLGNPSRNTFFVVMGDSSIRIVPKAVSDGALRNAIDRRDGLPLGPDWPR
jgi:hypothetical protein